MRAQTPTFMLDGKNMDCLVSRSSIQIWKVLIHRNEKMNFADRVICTLVHDAM